MKKFISYLACLGVLFFTYSCKNQSTNSAIELSHVKKEASCVFLTNDAKGNPAISWVENDSNNTKYFYFATWDKQKNQFSAPISIPIEQNAAVHEEGMPKIVFKGDGTLLAVYETSTPVEGQRFGKGDIRFVQSKDLGKTWTSPESVFKVEPRVSVSFGSITRLGNGEIGASCLGTNFDDKLGGRPVLFTKTDGQGNFLTPQILEKEACQCCRTAISSDENGNISIVYRDLRPGDIRDISLLSSQDFGNTFSKPEPFSDDKWEVSGCPHNGPSAIVRNGNTYVSWFSGGAQTGVHYAKINAIGEMANKKDISGAGRFIQLTVLPNGTCIAAYDENYQSGDSMYGKITVVKIDETQMTQLEISPAKSQASHPVICYTPDNLAVIAWKDQGKIYYKEVNPQQIVESLPQFSSGTYKAALPFKMLVSDIDPVCGMHLTQKSLGDTTRYQKDIVGFCSGHCKKQFVQNPETYPISPKEKLRFNL